MQGTLATVVINNYNYAQFLDAAIQGALQQTYPAVEVIVVDDGSVDGSRHVISRYRDAVTNVLKPNGGQASALNAGFARSSGDVVIFADADDILLPTAVERSVQMFEGNVVNVHWQLQAIDSQGLSTGQLVPPEPPDDGDFRETTLAHGPGGYRIAPTTGNAWARAFLDEVLPIPEDTFRLSADAFLFDLAPLHGVIKTILEPQSCYRLHSDSNVTSLRFDDSLEMLFSLFERRCASLADYCRRSGIDVDEHKWVEGSWFGRLRESVDDIANIVPPGGTFVLVDDEQWGTDESVENRRRVPFLERDGRYWGPPPDDETAIRELERLRRGGAASIVFAWPSFWWLDHYRKLRNHLERNHRVVLRNDRLVAFDLR